jgi:hypothetical protein
MPYQSNSIDVFKHTRLVERVGDECRVYGDAYQDTKTRRPSDLILFFKRDIRRAINDGELPEMIFDVTLVRQLPIPCYQIEIQYVDKPVLLKIAEEDEQDINCEYASIGRVQLTALAHYCRNKIMQILWRYNADLISNDGMYGHFRFNYQIVVSPDLIEHQIKMLNLGSRLDQKIEDRLSGNAA